MRLLLAVLVLLGTASCAITKAGREFEQTLLRDPPTMAPLPPTPSSVPGPTPNAYAKVYELTYHLGVALVARNFTWAASLIDDRAMLVVPSALCGSMNKTQFLTYFENNRPLANFFQLQEWTGVGPNTGLFKAQVAAVLPPSSQSPNATKVSDAWLYSVPNQKGDQLFLFEMITTTDFRQSNATALAAQTRRLIDASRIRDLSFWADHVTDDVAFWMFAAFDQFKHVNVNNKTGFLGLLEKRWAEFASYDVQVVVEPLVFCDSVGVEILWSGIRNDGSASINKFALIYSFNEKLQVTLIEEYAMMPFA